MIRFRQVSRRLDLAGIIGKLRPVRDAVHVAHGQVIEVLVTARLSSPTSMVRVGDWARLWSVEEVFGVDAALRDDRFSRALDTRAPHLDHVLFRSQPQFDRRFQPSPLGGGDGVLKEHRDRHGTYASRDGGYVGGLLAHSLEVDVSGDAVVRKAIDSYVDDDCT